MCNQNKWLYLQVYKRMKRSYVILIILAAVLAIMAVMFASGVVKIITPPEGSIEIGGPDDTFFSSGNLGNRFNHTFQGDRR